MTCAGRGCRICCPDMRVAFIFIAILISAASLSARPGGAKVWRILDDYAQNYGAGRTAKEMSTVLIEGTQIQGEQTFDFSMRKKRPNSIRYQMSSGANSMMYGFNGRIGWQRIERDGSVRIDTIEGEALSVLKEEAEFDGPLLSYLHDGSGEVEFAGMDRVLDQAVFVLNATSSSGRKSRYYIAEGSSYLLKCEWLADDGTVSVWTVYSDYKLVDGYPFAHVVETYCGNEKLSRVEIQNIKINPGVLSFYFEKPRN